MCITFEVVVVSDTIYQDKTKDISGMKAIEILSSKGYEVRGPVYIPNNFKDIVKLIMQTSDEVDIIVFIGGTGPSPRDITIDVINSMAWRKLPGFGEVFRRITYETEGVKAIFSRTELYILPNGKVAVALPGSPKAVEVGLNLLLSIAEHLVEEVRRYEGSHKS